MLKGIQMNNQVVFAAAGNGKTYAICECAREAINSGNKYVLLISYTNEGIRSLENEYRKQNNGVLHERLIIKSWYSFLLSEFIKPYQCLLQLKIKSGRNEYDTILRENLIRSIAFYQVMPPKRGFKQTHLQYYINGARDIIPDRVSHLAYKCNEDSGGKSINRMERIYSHVFIDELQDYAGWDLEIIKLLFNSAMQLKCVGDYKQATFRTNKSPKNKQYHDEAIRNFFVELEKENLCSLKYATTTRRFNQEICDFINTICPDEESTVKPDTTLYQEGIEHRGVYLIDIKYLEHYCAVYRPVILRFKRNVDVPFQHSCEIFNYGGSKGATYERTVIIPVGTVLPFLEEQVYISANQTRARFYVACTRAKYSVVFATDDAIENNVFKAVELEIDGEYIPAFKYNNPDD
ncbi:MAG: UvrD-helicase domain-containing protein [Clostridiaceae bacterium]|nr:UvrD-helicase domain-containing protein [Clostridiaceae bacterium]